MGKKITWYRLFYGINSYSVCFRIPPTVVTEKNLSNKETKKQVMRYLLKQQYFLTRFCNEKQAVLQQHTRRKCRLQNKPKDECTAMKINAWNIFCSCQYLFILNSWIYHKNRITFLKASKCSTKYSVLLKLSWKVIRKCISLLWTSSNIDHWKEWLLECY